ncbi:hypothetical protein D0T53_10125 [Dysgonomonas sp. 216]|uniref:DUF6913 domain-containing protein n=1 Tax=Dysgonomonas sp. 216 TaxID=2302934 RepID=UPI0013D85949|nr:hypothetical protein [Dysgonomonas sp. 216]NDW19269.1 hypothetical protein [Dysgonomonas sp. 216]
MFNFLQKKKIGAISQRNTREKAFLNYDSIKQVLLLFNIDEWNEVAPVVKRLLQQKKKVIVWTVRPKRNHAVLSSENIRVIDAAKELTWTHALRDEVEKEFRGLHYDTLIDLTTLEDNTLNYLLAANSSRFCIGIRESKMKLYDFIMLKKEDSSIIDTFEQMQHYLSSNMIK